MFARRLTTLEGLQGLRAGWVDRASAAGHLVPKMHLSRVRRPSPRGFFGNEAFLGSHIAVVDALLSDRIDVGATFCKVETHSGRILHAAWTAPDGGDPRPVRVLSTIGPIPNDVIMAGNRLPAEARTRVLRWFLDPAPRVKELLGQLVRADAYRSVTPSHLEPLRKMMAASAARGETPWRDRMTSIRHPLEGVTGSRGNSSTWPRAPPTWSVAGQQVLAAVSPRVERSHRGDRALQVDGERGVGRAMPRWTTSGGMAVEQRVAAEQRVRRFVPVEHRALGVARDPVHLEARDGVALVERAVDLEVGRGSGSNSARRPATERARAAGHARAALFREGVSASRRWAWMRTPWRCRNRAFPA